MLVTVEIKDTNKLGPERARAALTWALSWRGEVTEVKRGKNASILLVEVKVSDSWEAKDDEKLAYLKDWLTAKTRMFTVKDVRG